MKSINIYIIRPFQTCRVLLLVCTLGIFWMCTSSWSCARGLHFIQLDRTPTCTGVNATNWLREKKQTKQNQCSLYILIAPRRITGYHIIYIYFVFISGFQNPWKVMSGHMTWWWAASPSLDAEGDDYENLWLWVCWHVSWTVQSLYRVHRDVQSSYISYLHICSVILRALKNMLFRHIIWDSLYIFVVFVLVLSVQPQPWEQHFQTWGCRQAKPPMIPGAWQSPALWHTLWHMRLFNFMEWF